MEEVVGAPPQSFYAKWRVLGFFASRTHSQLGASVDECAASLKIEGDSPYEEMRDTINNLAREGYIYETVDDHFKESETMTVAEGAYQLAATLENRILFHIEARGATEKGTSIAECVTRLQMELGDVSSQEVHDKIAQLESEGYIYTTVDDDHFKATSGRA